MAYFEIAQQRADNIQVNAPKDIDNKKGIWNGSTWRPYASLTTLAVDGFYAQGDFSGVVDTKYLLSGVNQY